MKVVPRRPVVAGAVLVFLFVVGSFEYLSFTQTSSSYSGVSFDGVTLASPTALNAASEVIHLYAATTSPTPDSVAAAIVGIITSVRVNITLSLYDGGVFPVYIPSETHQVFIDGLLVGTGETRSLWIWPGASATVQIVESISTGELLPIVSAAIASGGKVQYDIVGSASFAGGSAPFTRTGQIDVGAYIASQLHITIPGVT
ncbi:MAG: hypothetical protein JRN54_08035 [Nitrososphaerota archaeon]|jgi:hypothetical protein|nr:hypothetical protein [Nitrososphaerota archaeon]